MSDSNTIVVTGSREWTDEATIEAWLRIMPARITTLAHGGAAGADVLAGAIWRDIGRPAVQVFTAAWLTEGRAAGHARNERMIRDARPDRVIAFAMPRQDRGQRSRQISNGTLDCIERALARRIPVIVVAPGSRP
jgi:hypothetical protein